MTIKSEESLSEKEDKKKSSFLDFVKNKKSIKDDAKDADSEDDDEGDEVDDDEEDKDESDKKKSSKDGEENDSSKKKKVTKEEESLDELSKETLSSYIVKSAVDRHKKGEKYKTDAGNEYKASSNLRRVKNNGPDYDYGETDDEHKERVDRLDKKYKAARKETGKTDKSIKNRNIGISTAAKKLAKEDVDMTDVNEQAEAPKAASNEYTSGSSKIALLSKLTDVVSDLDNGEFVDFFNKVMDHIGHEGDKVPSSTSSKNFDSVKMKGDSKDVLKKAFREEASELFGSDELTEEFKEKASTLFEAAVNTKVNMEIIAIQEQLENDTAIAIEEKFAEIEQSLDEAFKYLTESWYEDNKVAINNSIKMDILESFMNGMKSLFEDHYIDIPDEKISVVEELASRVEELENDLNSITEENLSLKNEILENEKEKLINTVSEGFSVVQKQKFSKLVESVEFDGDVDSYSKKLNIIKNKYFVESSKSETPNSISEEFNKDSTDILEEQTNDLANRYASSITKFIKR